MQQTDCVKAQDLCQWLKLLPSAHVTFLMDCEQNFIAKFGKQRAPDAVDMVEAPWSMLTGLDLTTVVYYLEPDMSTLPQLTEKDVRKATGSLTESFNFAFFHCFMRTPKGQNGYYLSHRRFYEAISFYWHKRGRLHQPFVPAIVVSLNVWTVMDVSLWWPDHVQWIVVVGDFYGMWPTTIDVSLSRIGQRLVHTQCYCCGSDSHELPSQPLSQGKLICGQLTDLHYSH